MPYVILGQEESAEGEEREPGLGITHWRIRPARGMIYGPDLDTYWRRDPFLHLPGRTKGEERGIGRYKRGITVGVWELGCGKEAERNWGIG